MPLYFLSYVCSTWPEGHTVAPAPSCTPGCLYPSQQIWHCHLPPAPGPVWPWRRVCRRVPQTGNLHTEGPQLLGRGAGGTCTTKPKRRNKAVANSSSITNEEANGGLCTLGPISGPQCLHSLSGSILGQITLPFFPVPSFLFLVGAFAAFVSDLGNGFPGISLSGWWILGRSRGG